MNNIKKHIAIVAVICSLSFISCGKWLDVDTQTSIKEDDLFKTEAGYFDALVGVYSLMTSNTLYGDNLTMSFMEILAYSYKIDYNSGDYFYQTSMFQYTSTNVNPRFASIWSKMYEAIANANNLLSRLEKADKSIFDAGNYNLIKGELLAVRAYLHFDLLRMFGPASLDVNNEKCMPYVSKLKRESTPYSTPKEIIGYALDDLTKAREFLQNDPIVTKGFTTTNVYLTNRNTRMNYLATKALIARIKLYAGDKQGAMEMADDIIDNQTFITLLGSPTQYANNRTLSPEHFFGLYVDVLPTTSDHYYVPNVFNTRVLFNDNSKIDAIYELPALNADIRFKNNFIKGTDGIYTYTKYARNSSDAMPGYCRMPMLKMSEMYLISAECTDDMDKAAERMNALRYARSLKKDQVFANADAVHNYIKKEYRKEFYAEGQIFYFYKRMNYPTIPDCPINIKGKEEKVYRFPLPANEIEFAGK